MQANAIQIRIVSSKPNKIEFELVKVGKIQSVPRKVFQRRREMGIYEVTNPSKLPSFI